MPGKPTYEELEQRLYELEQAVTERKKSEKALHEGIRELQCLYGISRLIESERTLQEILQGTADLVPDSWQYPDITSCLISLNGNIFKSEKGCEKSCNYCTHAFMSRPIFIDGNIAGEIRVCYTEQRPEEDEGPFLQGERDLINAIAAQLGRIVSHKKAMEALSKNRMMLARTESIACIGSWEWEIGTDTVIWSEGLYRIFQINPETRAPSWTEHHRLYHPEDFDILSQAVNSAVSDQTPYELEVRALQKDGEIRICKARGFPETGTDGRVVRMFGFLHDITERKQAEKALRESEFWMRGIFDSLDESVIVVTPTRKIIDINKAAERIFGYSKEESIGNSGEVFHVDRKHFEEVGKYFKKVLERGETARFEFVSKRKNGEIFPSEHTLSILKNELGEQLGIVSIIRDISERKQAEEEREKLQAQLSNALEMARLGPWEYDVAKDLFTFNDHFYRIFRTSAEEIGGYTMSSAEYARRFVHPDDIPVMEKEIQDAINTKDPNFSRQLEHRIIFTDESVGYINVQFFVVKDSRGNTIRTYGVNQDITERRQAEEELRRSEGRLTSLVDSLFEALIVTDTKGMIKFANPAACNLFGRKREQLIDAQFGFPITMDEMFEIKVNTPESETRYAEASATVTDWVGEKAYLISLRDVTERRLAEQEREQMNAHLQQLQRTESIGTLAGGIAHDFNNILSPIIGFTELTMDQVKADPIAKDYLEQIYQSGKRAKDLVKQILVFSRQGENEFQPILLTSIVKEILKMLRSTLPATIEIRQDIAGRQIVMGEPTGIHQILMNLCTNAKHAMGENGGVLSVSVEDVNFSFETVQKNPELRQSTYVRLRVEDTGHGMPPSVMEKIFEPYFTTKGKEGGTGLGLSVAHGIVKSHGGVITVKSKPGEGTAFDIYLPTSERDEEEKQIPGQEPKKGNEHILLVDDEPSILQLTRQVLEKLGYKVSVRASSLEALELFKSKSDTFDLLLTDMTMPQMTGDKLALECTRIRPNLPVILSTGFSEKLNRQKTKNTGIHAFLYKPISKMDMAETVRNVLDKTRGQAAEGRQEQGRR